MDFSLNLYALLPLLTLLQAVVFGGLLILRGSRDGHYADFWLALLLILIGLSGVPYMLGWMQIGVLWQDYPFMPWDGFHLAIVPSAFIFLRSLLNEDWRFQKSDLRFYALYFIYFFYHLIIGLQGKEFAKWWWYEVNNRYFIDFVFSFLNIVLLLFYLSKSVKMYATYRAWILEMYSNTEGISFVWFRNFLYAYAAYLLIETSLNVLVLVIGPQYDRQWFGYFATLVLTYYLSIFGYNQKKVTPLKFPTESSQNIENEEIIQTENKAYILPNDINLTVWKEKILDYFVKTQPYLNAELKLVDIAQALEINVSTLSTVINLSFEKNFNDLVNEYRVEACKRKMQDKNYAHLSLLGIAYESGFNSKTTFNRAFKKYTNQSPSEFQKKYQNV
jgi:AraC-like DNA-binding protein